MIRILVVDDHEVVRTGLRALLGCYPEYEVVGEAAGGSEAITVAIETKPDVVVLDYYLPLFNGLHVARKLRSRSCHRPKSSYLRCTIASTSLRTR